MSYRQEILLLSHPVEHSWFNGYGDEDEFHGDGVAVTGDR